jgi:extradiol dioxygenase family protein
MNPCQPFHLALPVTSLERSREFYGELLGCAEGRCSERWIDFDFWGHQLVVHLVSPEQMAAVATNPVDGEAVPAAHFGPVLPWDEFEPLVARLRQHQAEFVIEPTTRFAGRRGEQMTLFIKDPSGNHLEFKSFRNIEMLFARDGLDYP